MVALEFEVVPDKALRNDIIELILGMPINQALAALQNVSRFIRNIELVYSDTEPFEKDITVTLKSDGIRLLFDAKSQVLKLIEVFDFKNITLHYCGTVFSKPGQEANVDIVEKCFGATHPGVFDEQLKMYMLSWRGVSFCFPTKDSSTVQPSYAHGLGSLHFANSALPFLQKMTIFSGNTPAEMKIPEIPTAVHCGNNHLISIDTVLEGDQIVGLCFVFMVEDQPQSLSRKSSELPMKRLERIIRFGDSQQSVHTALGAPSKIYYKSDEKMLIQRGSNSENLKDEDKPDFFFNYFTMGVTSIWQKLEP
uniref:Uncharacterized protein n=1 Tax=Acrobeloides nanus TaxID=290746 RepID=A0A914C5C0_9BILA